MSLQYSEVASTGISEEDFDALFASRANFVKQVEIYRQNPSFAVHTVLSDHDTVLDDHFTATVANGFLLMFYHHSATSIYYGALPLEDVSPDILGIWNFSFLDSCVSGSPIAVTSDGTTIREYHIKADGSLAAYSWLPTGGSVTPLAPTTYDFSDVVVEWMGVTEDGLGTTIYVVIADIQENRKVYIVGPTDLIDTGIIWPDALTGFSVESFIDVDDDSTGSNPGSDIRHCIAISSSLPNLYKYKITDSLPVQEVQQTGGIVSFVVRPPIGDRPIQVSEYRPVRTFDKFIEGVQYRTTCKMSAMSSMFAPDNASDTLWLACIGSDGDLVGADTYGYDSAYFYSSRDGANWSADQILPVVDILDAIGGSIDDLSGGMKLVRMGDYVYAITRSYVLRSLGCGMFGVVHPDLNMDITERVVNYSSTASDVRQTSIPVDNRDGYFKSTILALPGTFRLKTSIGAVVGDTTYKFGVSIEKIDAIEQDRERPNEFLRISSRDLMSLLMDDSQTQDAVQYDNNIVGLDEFSPVGGQENSGLAHTAVQSGVFGTTSTSVFSYLSSKSAYQNSVAYNTFKSQVVNGACQAKFSMPNPTVFTVSATADNAPTYAGVTFRGLDKDNYWFARYNFWTELIELGERRSGVDYVRSSVAPSSAFHDAAESSEFVGIRVEFKNSRIRVWHTDPDDNDRYIFALEYSARANTQPVFIPAMSQGYTGVVACGYSDQDTGSDEPPSISIGFDATDTSWGSENNFGPSQLFMLSTSGRAWRISGVNDTPVVTEISPDDATRTTLTHQGLMAIADPWSYGDALGTFGNGIARLNDYWTSPATPSAVWDVKYTLRTSIDHSYNFIGLIRGSINRPNYYGWLEHITAPDSDRWMEYCYTTDNFATVHYTYLGFDNYNYRRRTSLTIGCFNTNDSGLVMVFNPTLLTGLDSRDQYVLISLDWGATFTRFQPAGFNMGNWSPETWDGFLDLVYSKLGGGEDRLAENIFFSWYTQSTIMDKTGANSGVTALSGSGYAPGNTDQCYNSLHPGLWA
jgi:hypothetical protein